MKRIFLLNLIFCLAFLIACKDSSNISILPVTPPSIEDPIIEDPIIEDPIIEDPIIEDPIITKRVIKGVAAIGAFIEEGALVQVRPASVDGVTPEEIIEGVVTVDGNYEIVVPEEIPVEVESAPELIVSQILKAIPLLSSSEMEQGTGFIIRVYSEAVGGWVYSYAENNDSTITANVNPYTDMMVKRFYATANTEFIGGGEKNKDINQLFDEGIFEDGTPINVPSKETINTVMLVMSKMLYHLYGLVDIQNALNDSWILNEGLDALLDNLLTSGGRVRMNEYLQYEFSNLFYRPNVLLDACAIQNEVGHDVSIDIWTKYGNSGRVYLNYSSIPYGINVTEDMIEQPDSIENNRHFKSTVYLGDQLEDNRLYIHIEDCPDGGTNLMIKRP